MKTDPGICRILIKMELWKIFGSYKNGHLWVPGSVFRWIKKKTNHPTLKGCDFPDLSPAKQAATHNPMSMDFLRENRGLFDRQILEVSGEIFNIPSWRWPRPCTRRGFHSLHIDLSCGEIIGLFDGHCPAMFDQQWVKRLKDVEGRVLNQSHLMSIGFGIATRWPILEAVNLFDLDGLIVLQIL